MILNPDIEQADLEKIIELQAEKLKKFLIFTNETFPIYQQIYKKAKLGNIESQDPMQLMEKFQRIPFTEAKEYMAMNPAALKVIDKNLSYIDTTSGSTGSPKTNFLTVEDDMHDTFMLARCLASAGLKPEDKIMTYDIGYMTFYNQFTKAMIELGVTDSMFYSARKDFNGSMSELLQYKPDVLITLPSLLIRSMDAFMESQKKEPTIKKVVYISEAMNKDIQTLLKEEYGIDCFSFYGTTEVGVIGSECEAHDGIHLYLDSVIHKFKNPNDAQQDYFKKGNSKDLESEVGFTSLIHRGKPTLNYLIGDMVAYTDEPCECGRTLPRLVFKHRMSDLVTILGAKVSYEEIYETVYGDQELKNYMQIVLDDQKDEKMDLTVILPNYMRKENRRIKKKLNQREDIEFYVLQKFLNLKMQFKPPEYFTTRKIKKIVDNREYKS